MSEHHYYLTLGRLPDKPGRKPGWLAVISEGTPQHDDKRVVVCDVKVFDTKEEMDSQARGWFDQQLVTRPWEPRQ